MLVLGGTGQARELAAALHERGIPVVTSLAGRTAAPIRPPGGVRSGGFGGATGLAGWIAGNDVTALVDATHPFAETITTHAVAAAAATGVPLLLLRRPGWRAVTGDDWRRVPSLDAAAAALPGTGDRVLLATGRGGVAAFAAMPQWFLIRSVDPPGPPLPVRHQVVAARGPFALDDERALLREHRIEVLVTRDSGGAAVAAKLVAARELGLPVLVVDRPPVPAGVRVVAGVAAALEWLR